MKPGQKILITGGCGYIGSHTALCLLEKGFTVISIDNFSRSKQFIEERINHISGKQFINYAVDCRNAFEVENIFSQHPDISGIIHFAAYKSVGESVENPLLYYDNNINSLLTILKASEKYKIKHFVFSSSCSVYGNATKLPVTEEAVLQEPVSPYGRTKLISEKIIEELSLRSSSNFISLRYFNPVGAHASGLIGEVSFGKPDNIIPAITQTAIGKRKEFIVYGTNYQTRDGSCERDYIHVMDIADAHTLALEYLQEKRNHSNYEVFNLGSGEGITVLEMIHAFEKVSGKKLEYIKGQEREGDVVAIYADNAKAKKYLHWKINYTIEDMMRTAWNWEQNIFSEQI